MTTTRPHTNRDDVSELDRLREEYRNWWSATEGWTRLEGAQKADALITALGDEIAELTGQNIDLEVWRASAEERAERAEAEAELERVAEAEAMNILEGTELKLEQAEAEVALRDRMLDIACRSGINAVASNEATRQAMIQEVVDERLADLRAQAERREG